MEKYFYYDRTKSIGELENDIWESPGFDSGLTDSVFMLRKKPMQWLNAGDLRVMIGQKIGLKYLIPLSLEILEDNPLCEGDLYSGDLLEQVVKAGANFGSVTLP